MLQFQTSAGCWVVNAIHLRRDAVALIPELYIYAVNFLLCSREVLPLTLLIQVEVLITE